MSRSPNPNEITVDGDLARMRFVRRGGEVVETVFDAADAEKVRSHPYRWHVHYEERLRGYYVVSRRKVGGRFKNLLLARFIVDCPAGMVVDHINHDTLDNRRANLRVVPQHVNLLNKSGAYRNSRTGVRGVHWHAASGKWCAQVCLGGKVAYSELFADFDEACEAAKRAREQIFSEVM